MKTMKIADEDNGNQLCGQELFEKFTEYLEKMFTASPAEHVFSDELVSVAQNEVRE